MVDTTLIRPRTTTQKRPAWVPDHITDNWDTDPYAYQTEEELMAAGGPHNQLLTYLIEVTKPVLKAEGLMFLADVFLLYTNRFGYPDRTAPDLLLMPLENPPPSAYDLANRPPPLFVAEITSPSSHVNDLRDKVSFYHSLGIKSYLVVDAIRPDKTLRKQMRLYLWREVGGQMVAQPPAADGSFSLPELNVRLKAVGQTLQLFNLTSGERLRDLEAEAEARIRAEARIDVEAEARIKAEARIDVETEARIKAEAQATQALNRLRQTVLSMRARGMSIEAIADLTGLSADEIAAMLAD